MAKKHIEDVAAFLRSHNFIVLGKFKRNSLKVTDTFNVINIIFDDNLHGKRWGCNVAHVDKLLREWQYQKEN